MNVTFYVNTSETNKIDKNLTNAYTLEGTLRENCDVINPSIMVQSSSTITEYNYVYIPEFNRYYFINSVESVRMNLWRITLKVDVLMSFKDYIKSCTGIISDSTTTGSNAYINGGQWVTTCKEYTDIINFSNGFNDDGEFILITAGG